MRLWVTRAQPGASATAAALRALGHSALVAPLLAVEPIADARLELEGVAALAFTSANAVRVYAALSGRRDLPAYAVGEATAGAARAAGLVVAHVGAHVGAGDAAALADAIAAARQGKGEGGGEVLQPTAEQPAADLPALLAERGVAARAVAVYRTRAASALPAAVLEALGAEAAGSEALGGVLLHSPRAARTLSALLAAPALTARLRLAETQAFGLSPACLAPLSPDLFPRRRVADRPDEAALLALLPPP